MGLLSWFNGSKRENPPACKSCGSSDAPGMNGATEVRRPDPPLDLTVITFGHSDKEMLAGYCPVSEKIEPCTWKILPVKSADDSETPKIRILF